MLLLACYVALEMTETNRVWWGKHNTANICVKQTETEVFALYASEAGCQYYTHTADETQDIQV